MQIFLDTAEVSAIKKYASWGIIDGVTTNPSLIAKEGVPLEKRIKEITAIIPGPVSAEVIAMDSEGMVREGRKYAKWAKNIYVKLPMTAEGLKACKVLVSEGIHTNITLVFTPAQAVLAAKAGATLVSPFVGRLDDIGVDGMEVVFDIVEIFRTYDFETKVLAASIRHPEHVLSAMKAGADIATIPPEILDKLVAHPLTDQGIKKFLSDWEKMKS